MWQIEITNTQTTSIMKPFISETIKYIGVDDTDLDLFESQYIIPNGVSYNSYAIID